MWEWEEGVAEAISTFRTAVEICEQNDSFVFNHNEVILYKWVNEYDPELFKRIQKLVKAGKWHIMGGWYLQPDCNMPCGESFVRQILLGKAYFKKYFNAEPKTAINFDPFGHTPFHHFIIRRATESPVPVFSALPRKNGWKTVLEVGGIPRPVC